MQEVHTNNLIESWHNTLKTVYLKSTRKQRTDMLVYMLLNEVLIDLRKKVTQISLGFMPRRTNLVEGQQQDLCKAIPDEIALSMVSRTLLDDNIDFPVDEALEEVLVRSFSDEKNSTEFI